MGKIFYIIGKSATGKDHLYEDVLAQAELGLLPFVMYTTRPQRAGEQNGSEYWFVSEEDYRALREEGKIIEERTYQTVKGPWHYFTVDDGLDLSANNYLAIGTLESYNGVRARFGDAAMVPLYIEVDADIRLCRSIERERKQKEPKYAEICRRFLADEEDFSEDKILAAGITARIHNNGSYEDCLARVLSRVKCAILEEN